MDNNQIHNEIMRAMGRIEGKIDGILHEALRSEQRLLALEERVGIHQTFIDTWKGKMAIIASIISAGIAIAIGVIKDLIK
jgi:dihydrodipicolinate synthase/N-acetylneuraminate lyase